MTENEPDGAQRAHKAGGDPKRDQMVKTLRGSLPQASGYGLVSWLFLRCLALIYLVAFASIAMQIVGLAGAHGILPLAEDLRAVAANLDGIERYLAYPTLFWIDAGDTALQSVAWAGCVFALLLLFDILPRISLIAMFMLYLSLYHAAPIFMNFQWDYLLLESGFLAIFVRNGSRTIVWLYRWLLFRLRFLSGAAKLLSHDPTWANLTALTVYFETQPLPHVGGWYAHFLPEEILRFATGATLAVELLIPFMMFLPRGPRFVAAWATILMQVIILLTSNHNFFNLLTIALCLFLFDDRALERVVPARLALRLEQRMASPSSGRTFRGVLALTLASAIMLISGLQMWKMLTGRPVPERADALLEQVRPLRVVNLYHVFPTMKTERIEVVVEGSNDGTQWHPYVFRFKPGPPDRPPPLVLPHQPRLDWMMWFVPMGTPMNMIWFEAFLHRLLENAPPVMNLLESNPFPDAPPRYVRASLYRYAFTDAATLEETGQWWRATYVGPFFAWPWIERQTFPIPSQ